jgi:opacity protein-like surface antigen
LEETNHVATHSLGVGRRHGARWCSLCRRPSHPPPPPVFLPPPRDFNGLYIDVSKTRVGPIYGGGIEYALTPNVVAGVEYLRTDFRFTDSSPETPVQAKHNLIQNSVQFRLTYKFDPITLTVDTSRPTIH